jgi:brefeldin A-inhibited guanine nucleotide-exchange protein
MTLQLEEISDANASHDDVQATVSQVIPDDPAPDMSTGSSSSHLVVKKSVGDGRGGESGPSSFQSDSGITVVTPVPEYLDKRKDNESLPLPPPGKDSSDIRSDSRLQSPSPSITSGSTPHRRSLTMSRGTNVSVVLISTALETIVSSKEAKRSIPLRESAQRALELIHANEAGDQPREIFEPLRLACETRNEKLMVASLDCISKLISYSFFEDDGTSLHALPSPPPSPQPGKVLGSAPLPSLVDLVAHTITSCHSEATPDAVSLQIVKALLALVLSHTILVHHSSLLKAVRTVYNIFLLSTDPVNQMVAQGGLTQMVHHVFTRCRAAEKMKRPSEISIVTEHGNQSPSTRSDLEVTYFGNSDVAAGHEAAEKPTPPNPTLTLYVTSWCPRTNCD